MLSKLKPRLSLASIYDINIQSFRDAGYQHMILDMDNTITAWNDHRIDKGLKEWVRAVRNAGFRICLLSNNHKTKVDKFASKLGVLAAPKGGKPFSQAFHSALTVLDGSIGNTLVIGDQIFTDILGGNLMGMYTILVDPIDRKEFIGTRFTRLMECLIAGRRPVCKSQQQPR